MSFDLFLFRLDPNADFDTARVLLDNLIDKKAADPAFDARDAVDALLRIEPRYRRIDLNYAAQLRRERRTLDRQLFYRSGYPAAPLQCQSPRLGQAGRETGRNSWQVR